MIDAKKNFDIIKMQLINNFLYSVVDEMTQAVVRTSLSPITRDVFDFQCGVCRGDGELVLEGEGTLIHSLIYQGLISNWMRQNKEDTYPGDVIITNDPYSGAAHLPDIYLYRPIFVGDEIVAWAVAGGHQRDIGGLTPGSCPHNSTEIFQEGLRIPPVKLYERGEPNETLFTILKAASRVPDVLLADIGAFYGACSLGEQRYRELIEEHGLENLKMYLNELLDYTEKLTRAEIKAMPDGIYPFTDYLDDDGITQGKQIPISLEIIIEDDEITYDFTGTSLQVQGAMNNPFGTTRAVVLTALRTMMNPEIPRNSGAYRPVRLVVPEGTLLNPKMPAAVASRGGTIQRESDVMLGAQAAIRPEKLMACTSGVDTLINISGADKNLKPWILMESFWGGWGGRSNLDGVDYNTPPILNNSNVPCEVNEELYPDILYVQYAYVPDTEGAGKFRGSVAVVREWKNVGDDNLGLQLRVDRRSLGPYGLFGGHPGALLKATIKDGKEDRDVGKITTKLCPGGSIRIQSAGAGGWGNPLERDPEMVLQDVLYEKISILRARDIYGVIINEVNLEIDWIETQKFREEVKILTKLNKKR